MAKVDGTMTDGHDADRSSGDRTKEQLEAVGWQVDNFAERGRYIHFDAQRQPGTHNLSYYELVMLLDIIDNGVFRPGFHADSADSTDSYEPWVGYGGDSDERYQTFVRDLTVLGRQLDLRGLEDAEGIMERGEAEEPDTAGTIATRANRTVTDLVERLHDAILVDDLMERGQSRAGAVAYLVDQGAETLVPEGLERVELVRELNRAYTQALTRKIDLAKILHARMPEATSTDLSSNQTIQTLDGIQLGLYRAMFRANNPQLSNGEKLAAEQLTPSPQKGRVQP